MSGRASDHVEVLRVMDNERATLESVGCTDKELAEHDQARAAVAELVAERDALRARTKVLLESKDRWIDRCLIAEQRARERVSRKDTVYVITRKLRGTRITFPLCYQDTRKDAELFVKMLREDAGKHFTFNVRPLPKGKICVQGATK